MTSPHIRLPLLTGLLCIPLVLPSEDVQSAARRGVSSLSVASSSATKSPAFSFKQSLTLEDVRVDWRAGGLLTYEKSGTEHPIIHLFDSDGRDAPSTVDIPGAAVVHIGDVAHSESGTLAACGYALDSAGHRAGFVYLVPPGGQTAKVIRTTGLYFPELISLPADGSIWIKGWQPAEITGRYVDYDASVIRRFDKDGKPQGEYLSQRRVLSRIPLSRLTSVPGFLVSSSTRVGWHQSYPPVVYYEFLLDGTTMEYPGVPVMDHSESLVGFAMTDRGEVFASSWASNHSGKPAGYRLYTLDRDARAWRIVKLPTGPEYEDLRHLIGAQGNALVFNTKTPGVSRILTLN